MVTSLSEKGLARLTEVLIASAEETKPQGDFYFSVQELKYLRDNGYHVADLTGMTIADLARNGFLIYFASPEIERASQLGILQGHVAVRLKDSIFRESTNLIWKKQVELIEFENRKLQDRHPDLAMIYPPNAITTIAVNAKHHEHTGNNLLGERKTRVGKGAAYVWIDSFDGNCFQVFSTIPSYDTKSDIGIQPLIVPKASLVQIPKLLQR